MTPEELREVIDALPAKLAAWHAGSVALPMTLRVLATRRITQLAREGRHPALIAPDHLRESTRSEDRFRHAAMTLINWSNGHLQDVASKIPADHPSRGKSRAHRKGRRRRIAVDVVLQDFKDAVDLALDWQALDTVRIGLKTGDMTIRQMNGRHVWLENHRSAEVEALDVMLSRVTVLDPPTEMPDITETTAWFGANQGRADRLHFVPSSLRRAAWTEALDLLERQGTTVPGTTDLGGLTLDEARTCYAGLIAQHYLNELCTIHLGTDDTLTWAIKPDNLVAMLSARVRHQAATAFVELTRYSPGRSPVSAPLIPYRDLLLIPADLVSPIGFERTLLRAAAADPGRSGALGNILGDRAHRWAQRLGSIPGCQVAEQVKVKNSTGGVLGDLDVVAWDRERRLAVVFETKWPIDAATLTESYKVDSHIASGREQLKKHRAVFESGEAVVGWPRGWNVPERTEFRWWVGSAQQLDSTPSAGADGIGSTSLRLVEHLLPQPNLAAFLDALENFPLPRQGIEFDLVPQTIRAGAYVLYGDTLAIKEAPVPPPDRRTSAGWT